MSTFSGVAGIAAERPVKGARIGIVGITFKEDVPDIRNSRVPDIVAELREFGIAAMVTDPLADPAEAEREYGIELVPRTDLTELDGLILAVPHRVLAEAGWNNLFRSVVAGGVLADRTHRHGQVAAVCFAANAVVVLMIERLPHPGTSSRIRPGL